MVEKLNAMELENQTKEAAAVVFREVLGNRPGYSRGLGEMVMPKMSGTQQGGENAAGTLQDAQYYKAELEALRANVREILEKQAEFDKFTTYSNITTAISGRVSEGDTGSCLILQWTIVFWGLRVHAGSHFGSNSIEIDEWVAVRFLQKMVLGKMVLG